MKDVKRIFLDVSIYDYPAVQQKLTDMAAQGWHLEKSGLLGLWTFRRGEPKQVRYEIIYAPKASAFNSQPTDSEEDLADLCAQAGWEWVTAQAQMQIYRNDDPDATPLETDEQERLKNIRRTMKKHFFPSEALLIAVFLMQFFMHLHTTSLYPGRTLSTPVMVSALGMSLFVAVIHGIMALDGALWLRKARIAVEAGENIPENSFYRRFRWVIWAVLILYLLCLPWTVGMEFLALVIIAGTAVLLVTAGGIALCKQMNAPKWVNMLVPAGLSALVLMILLPMLVFSMDSTGDELPPAETLPVTLTQLTGEEGTERFILEEHSSFLSAYGRYWDTGLNDVRINYTIVDVKCPLFYNMLQGEQEQQFMQSSLYSYLPIDGEVRDLFGAEYVRHSMNNTGDRWLICWDDRIVSLRASWELTEEQIDIIVEQLKP